MDYTEINRKTINAWVEAGWEWGRPVDHASYQRALTGEWALRLTPTKVVPPEWFGKIAGSHILGLAAGGGQQMPILAALGAVCTVLDYSDQQIASEKAVALREHYTIDCVQADMTKPLPFADASFDMVFHPVANCYVEDVLPIWRECYRVLRPGGRLLSGFDIGLNYIFDQAEERLINKLPFNPLKNPEQMLQLEEDNSGVQFSHTLEEQIGGQLKAGFSLAALYEDTNGKGNLHEHNVPSFVATLSIKQIN